MTTRDPRENSRANVFLMAVLAHGKTAVPVRIRNISPTGALLDAKHSLPPAGSQVALRRGDLSVTAEIVWQDQYCCGARFDRRIDPEQWVKRLGHAGQRRVDSVIAKLRAGVDLPLQSERPNELAEVLRELSVELTEISEDIADLPDLTDELCAALVRLDAVGQRLRQCAANDGQISERRPAGHAADNERASFDRPKRR